MQLAGPVRVMGRRRQPPQSENPNMRPEGPHFPPSRPAPGPPLPPPRIRHHLAVSLLSAAPVLPWLAPQTGVTPDGGDEHSGPIEASTTGSEPHPAAGRRRGRAIPARHHVLRPYSVHYEHLTQHHITMRPAPAAPDGRDWTTSSAAADTHAPYGTTGSACCGRPLNRTPLEPRPAGTLRPIRPAPRF